MQLGLREVSRVCTWEWVWVWVWVWVLVLGVTMCECACGCGHSLVISAFGKRLYSRPLELDQRTTKPLLRTGLDPPLPFHHGPPLSRGRLLVVEVGLSIVLTAFVASWKIFARYTPVSNGVCLSREQGKGWAIAEQGHGEPAAV